MTGLPSYDRAALPRALEALEQASSDVLVTIIARAAALLQERGSGDVAPATAPLPLRPEPAPEPRWMGLEQAAAHFTVNVDTMRSRAKQYGVGHKPGGQWRIDAVRYEAFRDGRPYERLPVSDPGEFPDA